MDTMGSRIKLLRTRAGLSQAEFGKPHKVTREAVGQWERGISTPEHNKLEKIARDYGVTLDWLSGKGPEVVIHNPGYDQRSVATPNKPEIEFRDGDTRTGGPYKPLTELIYVIGSVQAGAWKEACQLPEEEWKTMHLPADPMFPGVQRYALRNVGESMNKKCVDGGTWVFVRLRDLTGVGVRPGDYVIVERRNADGKCEATCKRFRLGADGKRWLDPESNDPTFQPICLDEAEPDIESIEVIGLCTDALNPLLRGQL